jgi:transketolase
LKRLTKLRDLRLMANILREDVISALLEAKSGHSAGPMGMAEVFTALYFNVMKHNPKKPTWEGRDRFILSNGHICPIMYVAMANAGYFPKKELFTLRKLGTRLQGHPHRETLPGLETTSGPLGSGLSQAAGMALVFKMDKKKNMVFCSTGDGEQNEGNHWEAVMFAAKNKLNNLVAFTDRNYIQIDGNTQDVMPMASMVEKYKAFNWNVIEIDGNSMLEVLRTFQYSRRNKRRPLMIICNTIPGKGIDFMEGKAEWHGKPPNAQEAELALSEIHAKEAQERGDWYHDHAELKPIHN